MSFGIWWRNDPFIFPNHHQSITAWLGDTRPRRSGLAVCRVGCVMDNRDEFEVWYADNRTEFSDHVFSLMTWNAARASQWRPVTDGRIENNKEYFVYSPTERVKCFTAIKYGEIHGGWWRSNGEEPAPHDDYFGDGDLGVTHYCELPQPPENV